MFFQWLKFKALPSDIFFWWILISQKFDFSSPCIKEIYVNAYSKGNRQKQREIHFNLSQMMLKNPCFTSTWNKQSLYSYFTCASTYRFHKHYTAISHVLAPTDFKLQQKFLKFNYIYLSWASPKTDLETNFEVLRTSVVQKELFK